MAAILDYYIGALSVLLALSTIDQVIGQPTVHHGSDATNSVVTELNDDAIQRLNDQVQSMRKLLSESMLDMRSQIETLMRSQIETLVRSLQTIDQRFILQDIRINNQSENSCRLATEVPTQLDLGIDLGGVSVLLPTINNWVVLLQRLDGSLTFNQNWNEYKNGFGDIGRGEIWLGNEKVHRLTNGRGLVYTLRIEVQLKTSYRWFYAEYSTFSLDSESSKYTLRLSGFSGSAGDSLTNRTATSWWLQGGMKFTTLDSDNDNSSGSNCAQKYQAGFWYNSCWLSCLTCHYGTKFAWQSLEHLEPGGSLRAARMMIKGR